MNCEREVYYFGCWGRPGHYLWTPTGRRAANDECTPWRLSELDGELAGDTVAEDNRRARLERQPIGWCRSEDQPEGVVRHHQRGHWIRHDWRGHWTAISFWDRSCDSRPGSNSAFIARGDMTGAEMLALFERSFPAVWERIAARFPLVLAMGGDRG